MASQKRKEPIHKLFYLCSTCTPDAAWSEFLRDCSFGKFPKGVRFENGMLKCSRKKQTFSVPIPNDVEKAVQIIIAVFRDKLQIKTARELKSAALRFDRERQENQIKTWKDASTIAAKTSLIRNFIERFSIHYGLTPSETREMTLLIDLAMTTKCMTSKKIVMQEGKIVQIEGLRFDPYSRKITLDCVPPKVEVSLQAIAIDFMPVRQMNHDKIFGKLLTYHGNKSPNTSAAVEE